jgi:Primase X
MDIPANLPPREISPIEGLDYILSHFVGPIWPRNIATRTTEGRQLAVHSRKEALARFAQANWLDCRISAYPPNATVNPSGLQKFQGLPTITPRFIIVIIDLDQGTFKSDRALNLSLIKALRNIKSTLNVEPTVIWSGNGYHIYLVMQSEGIVLENIKEFSEYKIDRISVEFLRFVENFLSYGKSDKQHNTTVSFNNSMMRIPGSFNSKNNSQIRIVKSWQINPANPANAIAPIKPLLRDFRRHLIDLQIQELRRPKSLPSTKINNSNTINWIERLLQTPLDDHRKYCIWRILSPYLVNIRDLTRPEVSDIINQWLDLCSELRMIDFNRHQRINDGLEGAAEGGYLPISFDKLRDENPRLYDILVGST